MKIGILMGGISGEREISILTGNAVLEACNKIGYDTTQIILGENINGIIEELQSMDKIFISLHGGIGENGTIQGFLETLGIPYTGSGPLSSAIGMNKHISKSLVRQNGILTPNWHTIVFKDVNNDCRDLDYPLVVKPNDQGSSLGVTIVKNDIELEKAKISAFKYGSEIIIEKFIHGRELSVSVIGGDVYPIIEIIPSHKMYDYNCKYSQGMSTYQCPAHLSSEQENEIQAVAKNIYKIHNCRSYSRIDFRFSESGEAWFLEINTLPGMTDTSLVPIAFKAQGGNFEELIQKIVEEDEM